MTRKRPIEICTGLLLFCVLLVIACQKEKSNETKSPAYFLTNAPWYFVRYDEDDSINGTIDYSMAAAACETGFLQFAPNDSLYYTPGSSPCSPSDLAWKSTWSLDSNNTVLHFSNDVYKIKTLNDSVLDYYYDSVYSNGEPYRMDFIYRHAAY